MKRERASRSPHIIASARSRASSSGYVRPANGIVTQCALGRSGCAFVKREGDGATPIGSWKIEQVLYRADRVRRPQTRLPMRHIKPDDGWCDDPEDRNYNRAVRLPYAGRHERLYRDDHVYDIVLILEHNRRPRMRNGGSAIFVHLARPNFAPTEGCVAVTEKAMRQLLMPLRRGSKLIVRP